MEKFNRLHLFEFEDLEWFPSFLRNGMTDYLRFNMKKSKVYDSAIPIIENLIFKTGEKRVVDLCSGAGGPIIEIINKVQNKLTNNDISVTLTDLYPNISAFEELEKQANFKLNYIEYSVDATNVPKELKGIRTIFSGFHHFQPKLAKSVLHDAVNNNAPIAVFEGIERSFIFLCLTIIVSPIIKLACGLFLKPLRLSRIFFTYILPLIPILSIWDGVISILRLYTPQNLSLLINDIDADDYVWEVGKIKASLMGNLTYMIGYPKQSSHNDIKLM